MSITSIKITPRPANPVTIRRPGVQGIQGIAGQDGANGTNGQDGLDGVQSSDSSVTDILAMTQAEYNALDPADATTFYIITD